MREISISWDPDPIGTIYIQTELEQWRLDCAGGLFVVPGHIRGIGSMLSGPQTSSPFLEVSAVKISITSSLSFYNLASFPASLSLLIVLSSTRSQTQTNLHYPLSPPFFHRPPSSNETFSWTMIDLFYCPGPSFNRRSSPCSVPKACARDKSDPATDSKRSGETVHLHPSPPCPIFLYSQYTHKTLCKS